MWTTTFQCLFQHYQNLQRLARSCIHIFLNQFSSNRQEVLVATYFFHVGVYRAIERDQEHYLYSCSQPRLYN